MPVDLSIELGVTGMNFLEKSLTQPSALLVLTSILCTEPLILIHFVTSVEYGTISQTRRVAIAG